MPFAPLFALLAPGGALLVLQILSVVPRLRPLRRLIVPVGAGLALMGVLLTRAEPPWPLLLSRWQPLRLFGNFPVLAPDPLIWPLAVALAGVVTGAALVQAGRPPKAPLFLAIAALGILSFGLLALWSENLLTLLMAWAAFDLAWGVGMLAFGLSPTSILWRTAGGVLATLLVWMGSLVLEQSETGIVWSLMVAPQEGAEFLFLAASLIRLGVYPFPFTLPPETQRRHPLGAALFLEPLLAWALLVRMFAQAGLPFPPGGWMEGLAAGTFLVGGLLALTGSGERTLPWVGLAAMGGILWAGIRSDGSAHAAAIWLKGGALWALGVSLLYLGRGWEPTSPWWTGGAGIGALALAAMPLLGGIAAPLSGWPRWMGFLLGQALLTQAVLRDWLRPATPEESPGLWADLARGTGLALLAILIGVLGTVGPGAPGMRPSLPGWTLLALWIPGTLGGVGLFWIWPRVWRGRSLAAFVHRALRLDWAYGLIAGALSRGTDALGAVADVAEGAGAVLWALAVFLLILVVALGL